MADVKIWAACGAVVGAAYVALTGDDTANAIGQAIGGAIGGAIFGAGIAALLNWRNGHRAK